MGPKSGKRCRTKIVCQTLQTATEAATELVKNDVGEMMCEPEFLEWCKTPRGGMLDPGSGKSKWDELVKNTVSLVSDQLGPPNYPTRIRVSVKDLVIFRDRISQTRSAEMTGRTVKAPDEANMTRMVNAALTGQGMEMAAAGGDINFDEFARALTTSGGGGSCAASTGGGSSQDEGFLSASNTGLIGSLRQLAEESPQEEDRIVRIGGFGFRGLSEGRRGG